MGVVSREMDNRGLFERVFTSARASCAAILYEHREIMYDELRERVLAVAETLRGIGIAEKDRVAILLTDSPEFISSFVAITSLGAIAAPINLALPREEQLFILKDCGARAAIIEASAASKLFEPGKAPPDLRNLIVIKRGPDETVPEIAGVDLKVFENSGRAPSKHALPDGWASDTNADAFILYTSGSTGEPKGAVHSQQDIFYTNETYGREVLKLRDGDRLFSSSRLPFAYGFGNSFTFPLLNGFTTILCREKPAPAVISQIFTQYRPTIFFGVPVVFRMLLEQHRSVAPLDTSSLRLCVSAGEALPAHLGQDWQDTFGVPVLDAIGSTEMLHMFMSNHEVDNRYGSSGRPLPGYEARLINHDGGATRLGEAGNLWIRGGSAASRYWNRPETSAHTFVDGWVRTGDLYRCDENEFWWHMGRSDDCFKSAGQWVSPIEVEGVLLRNEHVRTTAVVEGFDQDGLACACAFVVCAKRDENHETVERSLRAFCETKLPRFKQPRRYIFIAELPYTATGKVQRFKLRDELRAQRVQAG